MQFDGAISPPSARPARATSLEPVSFPIRHNCAQSKNPLALGESLPGAPLHSIRKPYLLFLGDIRDAASGKTAFGLADWCREDCVGQWRLPSAAIDTGLPEMSAQAAAAAGARSLIVGVAPIGGHLPEHWIPALVNALEAGLDLVSGLHSKLTAIPILAATASRLGRQLTDVRQPYGTIPVASGRKRTGKRLLTVGTDCALGKKYTALALTRALQRRHAPVHFRATGQTGIMISGAGIAIDAVVADFIAGAAEALSPDNDADHWDIIEGQGSLFHPAYAGVTLGLIHGSQPDALVLCHEPTRLHINGFPEYPLVALNVAVQRYLEAARLTNPAARFVAVSLNTSKLDSDAREEALTTTEQQLQLPCFDPMRGGAERIADLLLAFA
jgi:uncharacterized NAD-dependent epimerase/dehydratase family protein